MEGVCEVIHTNKRLTARQRRAHDESITENNGDAGLATG